MDHDMVGIGIVKMMMREGSTRGSCFERDSGVGAQCVLKLMRRI